MALEAAGKVRTVVLDKAGTVTRGEPRVTMVHPSAAVTREELLGVALSVERQSSHPLATAVTRYCIFAAET